VAHKTDDEQSTTSSDPVGQDQAVHLSDIDGPVALDGGEAVDARHSQGMVYKPSGPVTQRFGDEVHGDKIVHIHQGIPEPAPEPLPQQSFEPETLLVPEGPFLMGNVPGPDVPEHETPQHEVNLPAYWIAKYPVTNEQYAEFVRKTGRIVPPAAGWEGQNPPADRPNHPVSGVTWYDALAYCEWLSEQTSRHYKLPSEAQWEKAARGTDGRIYPWGDEWDPGRCNHGGKSVTAVDAYPEGESPYGCRDMIGNVREWTSTLWGDVLPSPTFCYPWADDRREDLTASKYVLRVYRGGSADRGERPRCSARGAYFPDKSGPPRKRHGFRVVLLIA
jgi:formylglycine-generating enzyme required for sulfatase activity